MTIAALVFLLLLIVAPVQAQDEASVLKAASDAGVAIVALVTLPLATRYLYLMVKAILDDKKAERTAAGSWFDELAKRHGLLKDAQDVTTTKLAEVQASVSSGKASADALASEVRGLMTRIEPAIDAMKTIEKDIKARDEKDKAREEKDREQDAETGRLATALERLTDSFNELKTQIEEGQRNENSTQSGSDGTAAGAGGDAADGNIGGAGAGAGWDGGGSGTNGTGTDAGAVRDGDAARAGTGGAAHIPRAAV